MFEFLKNLDARLYDRYLTVERNVKSASNSFYDSYLDMQEQFVKIVCAEFDIEVSAHETCGLTLKRAEVISVFKNTLGIDEYTFGKLGDYTLKVNAHKHKGEKRIQIDTIVSYLRVIYNATVAFANYKNSSVESFDANFYISIFGIFEKENAVLKQEVAGLKEELEASASQGKLKDSDIEGLKDLLSQAEISKLSLEDQNAELQRQISKLKDIKLSSMEEKLNKTIDLLNELTASVIENRAISYAVGDTICGRDMFKSYVEKAKEDLKHE